MAGLDYFVVKSDSMEDRLKAAEPQKEHRQLPALNISAIKSIYMERRLHLLSMHFFQWACKGGDM